MGNADLVTKFYNACAMAAEKTDRTWEFINTEAITATMDTAGAYRYSAMINYVDHKYGQDISDLMT